MKGIIASILVVLAGLFGAHATPSATIALHSSSTSSSVAARTLTGGLTKADTTLDMPLLVGARITKAASLPPTTSSASPAPSTLFQTPKPGVVLGTSTVAAGDLVTQAQLQTALNALRSQLFAISSTPSFSGSPATTAVNTQTLALVNKIDQLSGVTISHSTIDAASLPDLSGSYLSIAAGSGSARTALGLAYASSSDLIARTHIATWGDSLTAGTNGTNIPFTVPLARMTGYSIYNGGVGGQTSAQIEARMVADTGKYAWPTIIWAGRNDGCSNSTIEANIALMVQALQSVGNSNYVVLSILNSTSEGSGTGTYTCITGLNSDLAAIYGSHYLDVRSYLVSLYDPSQPQDVTDHANDTPPTSLRASGDTLHLNSQGYYDVAQYIYQNFSVLQPPGSTAVLTPTNILGLLANPPTIGSTTPGAAYFSRIAIGTTTNPSLLTLDANNGANFSAITIAGVQQSSNTILKIKDVLTNKGWSLNSSGGAQENFIVADPFSTNAFVINTGSSTNASFFKTSGPSVFGFGTTTVGRNTAYGVAISATGSNSASAPLLTFSDVGGAPWNLIGVRTASNAGWTLGSGGGSAEYFNLINGGVTTLSLYTGTQPSGSYWLPQNSGAKFGFGTSTAYAKLTVWGPDTASTSAFAVVNNASTTVFSVYDNGNATYSGSLFQSSDERLKTNIAPLDASSSLAAIEALTPVSYIRIDQPDQGTNLGFIAQAVQGIFPTLVSITPATALTPDGTFTLNYVGLISPIVAAIQALDGKVTALAGAVSGFAQNFATETLTADNGTFQKVTTQELCVGSTCVTPAQFRAIVSGAGQSTSPAAEPPAPIIPTTSSSPDTATSTATTTTTAPSIVPDYNATTTLHSAPAAVATSSVLSPTADVATSTAQ